MKLNWEKSGDNYYAEIKEFLFIVFPSPTKSGKYEFEIKLNVDGIYIILCNEFATRYRYCGGDEDYEGCVNFYTTAKAAKIGAERYFDKILKTICESLTNYED